MDSGCGGSLACWTIQPEPPRPPDLASIRNEMTARHCCWAVGIFPVDGLLFASYVPMPVVNMCFSIDTKTLLEWPSMALRPSISLISGTGMGIVPIN